MTDDQIIAAARLVRDGGYWNQLDIINFGRLIALAVQAERPVALETVYETIVHWDENGGKRSRRELARRVVDLYTRPPRFRDAKARQPEALLLAECLDQPEYLTHAQAARAAAEREACAKLCDDWPVGRDDVYSIGQAIRARGEK